MTSNPAAARVLWDTVTVIDAIEKRPDYYPSIKPVLDRAEAGRLRIVTSWVSLAETCKGENLNLVRSLFSLAYVDPRPVLSRTATIAQELIAAHNLTLGDALILATAIEHGVPTVVTRDGEGARKRRGTKPGMLSLDGKVGPPWLSNPIRVVTPKEMLEQLYQVEAPLFQ